MNPNLITLAPDKIVLGENVRKTAADPQADAELQASIRAHGLLQSIVVEPNGKGFKLVAGYRRLAAIKVLKDAGEFEPDEVPCIVFDGDTTSAALTENMTRAAMHPLDECEAYGALAESGLTIEEIAARFAEPDRHVLQRLALSALCEPVRAAYRNGDIGLDSAKAYTVNADHTAQSEAFEQLKTEHNHDSAWHIRNLLIQDKGLRGDHRYVAYVTLKVYEAEGGKVRQDLFADPEDPGSAWVEDASLIKRLASAKLDRAAKRLKNKAAWTKTALDLDWTEVQHLRATSADTEGAGVYITIDHGGKTRREWYVEPTKEKRKKREGFSQALIGDLKRLFVEAVSNGVPDVHIIDLLTWQWAKAAYSEERWGLPRYLSIDLDWRYRVFLTEEAKRRDESKIGKLLDFVAIDADSASFEAFLTLSKASRQAILAHLVRRALIPKLASNLNPEDILLLFLRGSSRGQLQPMTLAGKVKPTAKQFWSRMTKKQAQKVAEPYLGEQWFKEHGALKKGEFVKALEAAFAKRTDFLMPGFAPVPPPTEDEPDAPEGEPDAQGPESDAEAEAPPG